MILARLWIVRHEFTIFEFGAFDRGQTCDATHRRFDCDIKVGQNDPLFLLPMNASSFLDSHFLFHKNKPVPSQALHACHTLPPRIWTLTKIAWAEHLWSLANNSDVHMSTQIRLYSSSAGMYVICYFWLWPVHHNWILNKKHVPVLQHTWH